MLVIKSEEGQKIRVGDDICIAILKHQDGTVYIGVDAPIRMAIEYEKDRKTIRPALSTDVNQLRKAG